MSADGATRRPRDEMHNEQTELDAMVCILRSLVVGGCCGRAMEATQNIFCP